MSDLRVKLFRSIAVKLFLGMFASTAGLLLVLSYVSMRRTTSLWTRSFEEHATETATVTERALRYAMLLNRKDELHAMLSDIARTPTIESLRIYDKNGVIRFSSDRSEIGRRVSQQAEACVGCHGGGQAGAARLGVSRVLHDAGGHDHLARIQPIANEAQCSTARCHAHSPERTVLGVLDLRLSVDAIRQGQREARRTVLLAGLFLALVGGVGSALFIQRFVRRPVAELALGARRVADGKLETRIEIEEPGEFQELAHSFNDMTAELATARERSQRWEGELTSAVAEKTASLELAQRRLGHLEKMASLGKLSATVAHELNNPLAGILVYAKLVQREIGAGEQSQEARAELIRYLDVIQRESARCGEIVRNLLTFAREAPARLGEHRLRAIVERSLMTVQHLLREPLIQCELEIPADDELFCDGNQIQQALVALLVNAAEAMPSGGKIEIRARGDDRHVEIDVADSGTGIPAEVLPHIFEPFVSTKGEAKGVGLGLSVVYGIVSRHGGSIAVESNPGGGSVFRVTLPRRAPADAPAPQP